jgi:hypothetical protein
VSIRQHTCLQLLAGVPQLFDLLAYVSIRQHTSAYVPAAAGGRAAAL